MLTAKPAPLISATTRSIRESEACAAASGRSLAVSKVTTYGPSPGLAGSASTAWNGLTVTLFVPSATRPGKPPLSRIPARTRNGSSTSPVACACVSAPLISRASAASTPFTQPGCRSAIAVPPLDPGVAPAQRERPGRAVVECVEADRGRSGRQPEPARPGQQGSAAGRPAVEHSEGGRVQAQHVHPLHTPC